MVQVSVGYISEIFVSFQGEGVHAGRRQLFVRLSGCNLRCRYCDTPDSLERNARYRIFASGEDPPLVGTNPLTPSQVLARALPLIGAAPLDGVALTGGEPLLQAEFLAELLADSRVPRPRLLETSGVLPERLAAVLPVVDVVSMDIKLPSNTGEPPFWQAHRRFLAAARRKVYVKILVDSSTDPEDVDRAARLVSECAPEAPTFLQPITDPDGRLRIDERSLNGFFALVRRAVGDVRVLPQAHKMLGVR